MVRFTMLSLALVLMLACADKEKRAQALKDLDVAQRNVIEIKNQIALVLQEIDKTIGELEVTKDDLQQVKQFQLMRTESEREEQIKHVTQNILILEKNIDILKSNVKVYEDSLFRTEMKVARLMDYLKHN
jgi:hypothetical protein